MSLLCFILFGHSVLADGGVTVYVSGGGTGDGSSAGSPCGSIAAAVEKLGGAGGRIVLVGDTTIGAKTQIPAQSGPLTITSTGGSVLRLAMRLQFMPGERANEITVDTPISVSGASFYIFGGYNNVTFTENCTVTKQNNGKLGFFGGTILDPN
ncbi:MAG: hypothetical protein IJU41_03700, partial [Clostridia bacterium]|nr:hypothetical protein [Clostridia bacterium]